MVSVILRLAKEGARRVISLIVATSLMLLFTTGIGGVYIGKWILFVEGGSAGGGGGRSGGFWSSAAAPSNVGIAIAVTALAGLALAVTVVYSRRGSLKSPWSRRRRKHALLPKQWKSFFLPDGTLCDGGVKFLKKVRSGGVDPTIRAEVWPFLLGVYDLNSSKEERESIRSQNRKEYDNLRKQCKRIVRRMEKNSGSKENAEAGEYIGDLSQVLDSGLDDSASPQRSIPTEREDSERKVLEKQVAGKEGLDSKHLEGPADDVMQLPQLSTEVLEEQVAGKEGSDSKHLEGPADDVMQLPQLSREVLEKQVAGKEGSDSKHLEVPADDVIQLPQLSKEGDAEKSEITCETASPGDSGSSDSDTSESDDPEIIQPFLSSSVLEGSDLEEFANLSVSESDDKIKSPTDEDFATWQRIIRLDAVRANADWVIYSPSQASITELNARRFAESIGLKDYDNLEPCRVFHAARLVSILEAYALYDPEIGYCQGMSDLLSPIVSVIEDDSEAFWCFVGFMKKARHNFRLDEIGIRRQLNIVSKIIRCKDSHLYSHLEKLKAEDCFFVYRMVVVLFRRELNFDQTLCLWEVIWADQAAIRAGTALSAWRRMRLRAPPNDDLLLFAIAASVLQKRKLIIEKYSSMEEIMRECNSMAGHLDVWKLLDDAHDLVVNLHDKI